MSCAKSDLFLKKLIFISDKKLDHAALAVGYGEDNGEEYWLIKNSWSVSWGDKGFIKIAARDDNCGVTQKAVVVKVRLK